MYKVIHDFYDLQDERYCHVGDTYPREGYVPDEKRVQELLSDKNRQRRPLIELVKEEPEAPEQPAEAPVEAPEKPAKKGKKKE